MFKYSNKASWLEACKKTVCFPCYCNQFESVGEGKKEHITSETAYGLFPSLPYLTATSRQTPVPLCFL